ncbi:aryl-sulfate sulfotransferase [Haloglomus litoreum]|uniref:aryl-sulfate sulfotransferase n=1 Tax=Haloglomus litoreum TaxID=3034026 RepID=UPI0023E7DE60|nr:aryl-sulfate sulfotransferase [Haloglomus sp. DT116]
MSRLAVAVLAVCLVLGPVAPVAAQDGAATTTANATAEPTPELGACTGTMANPADGVTVVSVQGARFRPEVKKTTARLVAFGPRGNVRWVHEPDGVVWSYDVDPLENGDLFLTATTRVEGEGKTKFIRFDPETQEPVWSVTADFHDTHDADLLDEHRIAVANMRDPDPANGTNGDSLLVYNRTSGETEWEWFFDDHYPPGVGGNYSDDWTHVNDIDPIRGGEAFLASPRNLDQAIIVNRSTGEIDARLGRDDRRSVLFEQHNPMYLESDSGRPTMLVADSENDRLVEYQLREGANATAGTAGPQGAWERTWTLGSADSFEWPRDADRLANGNTLVGDSRHNRVLEVTPEGEVVWEVYAPWLVYDVARVTNGNEDGGPTIADQGASGEYNLSGDTAFSLAEQEECAATLDAAAGRGSFLSSGGAVGGVVQRLGGVPVVVGIVGLLVAVGAALRFRDRLV